MWVVSFARDTKFGTNLFWAGIRYVVNHSTLRAIDHHLVTYSGFQNYERRFPPKDLNSKPRILIYRHEAFGDQLMVTSVARFLKSRYPGCNIAVACSPRVSSVWQGIADSLVPMPLPFELAKTYDWHILYDEMLENDSEPEQGNCYDTFFRFAGIDPADVLDEHKRPKIELYQPYDYALWDKIKVDKRFAEHKFLVYQLQASNYVRTYPPELGAAFIALFAKARPDWTIAIVGRNERKDYEPNRTHSRDEKKVFFDELERLIPAKDANICNMMDALDDVRHLFPVVANAGLVVTPDTLMGHICGAFPRVPTISLWGPFHPRDRVLYYPNHHAIRGNTCPHSPCRKHIFTVPAELCEDAEGGDWHNRQAPYCNALASIKPEDILKTALELTE